MYNVTQQFATTAGESYNLRAYASEAQFGDVDAECSIKICVSGSCGPSTAISAEYSPYTYLYTADSEERSAVAIFSVECPASAYVALDSVRVASADPADYGPETITRYITRTATPSPGQVVTTTAIQRPDVSTKFITDTTTIVDLQWTSKILSFENTVTATATTTRAGATEYVNKTVSGVTTTTSKSCIALCFGL